MGSLRVCKLCQQEKSLDHFWKDNNSKDGFRARCGECCSRIRREGYSPTEKGLLLKRFRDIRVSSSEYNESGLVTYRFCRVCKRNKSISEYYNERKYDCKSCSILENRFRRYNITREIYDQMRSEQNFSCKICGDTEINNTSLVVDHNHKCCPENAKSCGKCIRGLLCSTCNVAIGMIKDNPDIARKLALYLGAVRVNLTLG